MNVHRKKPSNSENNASGVELGAAKSILSNLLLTCKNLSIYPPGHTVCNNSIIQFHIQLSTFIQKYGPFRIEIEKDRLLGKAGIISEGIPDEGTLHFALFQVGLKWLEIAKGIELEELNEILNIFEKYSKLSAVPEGDIVTALWEAQFPHLRYEVVEFSWDGDPGQLVDRISQQNEKMAAGMRPEEYDWDKPESQIYPPIDSADLLLAPQEKVILKEMVRLEEEADPTSYLEALLDSLLQSQEKENFQIILEVLSEEFTTSLARIDFFVTLKILQGLRFVFESCKTKKPWGASLIEGFFLNASGPDSLAPLKEIWREVDLEISELFEQVVKFFKPQAVPTLVSLLQENQTAPLRQLLLDSILFLASQDIHPLESLLNHSDEKLLEQLLSVLINLPGRQSMKYLIKLTRHSSSQVRNEAAKGILKRDPARVRDIFNLIDDEDDSIRQLVLEQLGRSRDETIEDLLLTYLNKKMKKINEEKHLFMCFIALGKCGSVRSIRFLREALFRWGWMPSFWRSSWRRGAAQALIALNIPEAERVLKEAGRSFFLGRRTIVRKITRECSIVGA